MTVYIPLRDVPTWDLPLGAGRDNRLLQAIAADDPHLVNLPYNAWRESQRVLLPHIVAALGDATHSGYILLEAPPGAGKSAFAAALSERFYVTVLTADTGLQQQYADDFPHAAVLWGRARYACANTKVVERYQHRRPNADDCPYPRPYLCGFAAQCPYLVAKEKAEQARLAVLNYAYAWYAQGFLQKRLRRAPHLLVLDEAHRLDRLASSLASLEVSSSRRMFWRLAPFPHADGTSPSNLAAVLAWVRGAVHCLEDHHQGLAGIQAFLRLDDADTPAYSHKRDRFLKHLRWIESRLNHAGDDRFYVRARPGAGRDAGLLVKPLNPTPYIGARWGAALFTHAQARPRLLAMSATLGPPDDVLALLAGGADVEGAVSAWATAHMIPVADRPVLFVEDAPAIGRQASDADYRRQADLAAAAIHVFQSLAPPGQCTTLIHTASWWHTRTLADLLRARGIRVTEHPKDMARAAAIAYMERRGTDGVIISPSLREGYDPPPNQTPGLVVIAKMPWASLGDPVTKARQRLPGGGAWYVNQAAQEVMQASGRGLRRPGDRSLTVVLDKHVNRGRRYFAEWFREAWRPIQSRDLAANVVAFAKGYEG